MTNDLLEELARMTNERERARLNELLPVPRAFVYDTGAHDGDKPGESGKRKGKP